MLFDFLNWGNDPKTALTNIVEHNGNYYYVDSRYTFDHGYETMIFHCDANGKVTNWLDLYAEWYSSQEEMAARHKQIVDDIGLYLKRNENEDDEDVYC